MTPQESLRGKLVDFLHEELVGPVSKDEILEESPRQRYSAGVLFPRHQEINETADEDASKGESPEPDTTTVVDRLVDVARRRG